MLEAAQGDPGRIQPRSGVAVAEAGQAEGPAHPDLFAKWDNALAGPYAELMLPAESSQIDFESELTIVIGRRCRRVAPGWRGRGPRRGHRRPAQQVTRGQDRSGES